MTRYIIRRVLGAIPLVLGVATIIFFILSLAPGDPIASLIHPGMSADAIEALRIRLGLDQPIHIRYVKWIGAFLQGDFGYSFQRNIPVIDLIKEVLPNTLLLSFTALVMAFAIGILIGVVQAVRQYSAVDSIASTVSLFFYSMPSFWLALMMVLVFAVLAQSWGWPIVFPASGMQDPRLFDAGLWETFKDRAVHLALPATSLALVLAAGIARFMRGSMLEVIRQDYVRTARAKGLPERVVIFRHAFRNALIPIITLLGLYLPVLFSGTVFVETVFAWPGMGRAIVGAIQMRDMSVVMAGSFIFATMVVVGNLLADILYAVVDPRIRYE